MAAVVDSSGRLVIAAGGGSLVITQPSITTVSLPTGVVGAAYSVTLAATGGTPPYTWSGSGVPAGLSLSTAGVLSGTPTTAATSTLTITATDSLSVSSQSVNFTLVVNQSQTGIVVTTMLPDAYVGSFYSGTLNGLGGSPPYVWAVSAGQPAWMSVDPGGSVYGTPTSTGAVVLTAQATDTVSATSANVNVQIEVNPAGQKWFGAQLPNLPTQFSTVCAPPTPANTNRGSYYTPGVGVDSGLTPQAAINAAAAATGSLGDVIVLQAGQTYTTATSFNLATRSGSGWIYIVSSQTPEIGGTGLPSAGTRVTRANIANMPSLRGTTATHLVTRSGGAGVAYYRLVGLDIELTDAQGSGAGFYPVRMNQSDTSLSTCCQHITFDRCYVAGAPTYGTVTGVNPEGFYMEVTECCIERCWQTGNYDSHAVALANSIGPCKIHNNYMTSGGEITLTGGGDTLLPPPNMPADLTITNNHYYKAWITATADFTSGSTTMNVTATSGEITPSLTVVQGTAAVNSSSKIMSQLTGSYGGVGQYQLAVAATATAPAQNIIIGAWLDKNTVEFKVGDRILFDSNFLECAGGSQQRAAWVLTTRNQNGTNPWYTSSDFTITNNVFSNCQNGGMQWLLQDSYASQAPTQPSYRFLLRNNIFILAWPGNPNSTASTSIGSMWANMPQSGSSNGFGGHMIWDHNTFVGPVPPNCIHSIFFVGGTTSSIAQLNNVVWSNNIWDAAQWGISRGGSPSSWNAAVVPQITQPVFVNNLTTAFSDATIPGGNFNVANNAAVGYTSYGSTTVATGYALTSGSIGHAKGVSGLGVAYNGTGTLDGTDIGCNIANLPTS